jgi:hypothetical protein
MADIKHQHHSEPVESDGVNYRAIVWFVVVLVGMVLASQLIVWGFFEFSEWRLAKGEAPRAPLAAPATRPLIENGAVVGSPGAVSAPGRPLLLVNEPMALGTFRSAEDAALSSYGWINRGAETIRLPIDRAKELVLERGLPVRPAPGATAPASPAQESAPAVAQ